MASEVNGESLASSGPRVVVPEAIIVDYLNRALQYIRDDYRKPNNNNGASLLALFCEEVTFGSYDFLDQLKKTLITSEKDESHIEVIHSFDTNGRKNPCVYLSMSSERDNYSSMGLGHADHPVNGDCINDGSVYDTQRELYTKRYDAEYTLTVISNNSNQALMLYHFFKALMVSLAGPLDTMGLKSLLLSGKGITFDPRLPDGVFVRVLGISFNYDTSSFSLFCDNNLSFGGLIHKLVSSHKKKDEKERQIINK